MVKSVIVGLKIMYLALFFSGCNHYKSIHFAGAKIQLFFHTARKSFMPCQEKVVTLHFGIICKHIKACQTLTLQQGHLSIPTKH